MAKFQLGRLLATPGALREVGPDAIALALARHLRGDWGDLGVEDRRANEHALAGAGRILSAYHENGIKFYIITEWDRSATTVLLPEEY